MTTATASTHSTGTTAHGLPIHGGLQAIGVWRDQELPARDAEAEPLIGQGELQLRRIVVERDAETNRPAYRVVEGPTISFSVTHRTRRSGKRTRKFDSPADLLDSFYAGGEAWNGSSDLEVWEAARRYAEQTGEFAAIRPTDPNPTEAQTAPPFRATAFSGMLWHLNAVVNLGLAHRMGGVGVRLEDVAGRQ